MLQPGALAFKGKYFTCPPEVEYRGYQLRDITMVPRPKHLPVEVWMPVASGKTIDMMARYGLNAMVTLNGEKILDDVVRASGRVRAARAAEAARPGHDLGTGLYLAASQEEAIRHVEPAHDERYKWFAPFGFVRYARRARPHLGHARRAGEDPVTARRGGAEGVVLRPARPGDRRHPLDEAGYPASRTT